MADSGRVSTNKRSRGDAASPICEGSLVGLFINIPSLPVLQDDDFHRAILLHRFHSLFAAMSALFDTAAGTIAVEENLTAFERSRHAQLPRTIPGPDAGDQAVIGAVRKLDRLC